MNILLGAILIATALYFWRTTLKLVVILVILSVLLEDHLGSALHFTHIYVYTFVKIIMIALLLFVFVAVRKVFKELTNNGDPSTYEDINSSINNIITNKQDASGSGKGETVNMKKQDEDDAAQSKGSITRLSPTKKSAGHLTSG